MPSRLSISQRLLFAGMFFGVLGIVSGVVLEGALRLRHTGSLAMPESFWLADEELIYRPNFDHPETPGPWRRGDPGRVLGEAANAPARQRVVCLGGSTTYGYGVEWNETWPHFTERALAERGLDVEVLNAGVNGYGSRQFLLWYRRELAEIESRVLVLYAGWNRAGAILDPGEWWPHTTPRRGDPWLRTAVGWASTHSMLFARLRALVQRAHFEAIADDFEMDRFHEAWVEDMTALVREAQARNREVLIVLYPALFLLEMTDAERDALHGRFFMEKNFQPIMQTELARKHAAARAIVASEGAAIVDVAAAMSGIRGAERDPLFLDEAHLSAAGNAVVGSIIAEALLPLLDHRSE